MGIEYSLANHKTKKLYELGKGSWYIFTDLHRKGNEFLLYKEIISKIIIEEMGWWSKNDADNVAEDIIKFIGDVDPSEIQLVNDLDDSRLNLYYQGYLFEGSRYNNTDKHTVSDNYINKLNDHAKSMHERYLRLNK